MAKEQAKSYEIGDKVTIYGGDDYDGPREIRVVRSVRKYKYRTNVTLDDGAIYEASGYRVNRGKRSSDLRRIRPTEDGDADTITREKLVRETRFINPTTGSDQNDGSTALTPLATWAEFLRRVKVINQDTTVTIASALPATDPTPQLKKINDLFQAVETEDAG
jgi:hypothetical protein